MIDRGLPRRRFLALAGPTAACLWLDARFAGVARAGQEPCAAVSGQTVRWIVPFSPGGGYDISSRLLAPFYETKLGAEIVVTNTPGAGGIVGAKALRDAPADGLTLGVINAAGLLVAWLSGNPDTPSPIDDFTILGRMGRVDHVWAVASTSDLQTIDDVLDHANSAPIVFGITDVGGAPFVSTVIGAHLIGLEAEFLPGYPGSRETWLGMVRNESDVGSFNFESVLDQIEAGELRPILQISDAPIAAHDALAGVPLLGGPDGLAARRAATLGRDAERAERGAQTLSEIIGAGRMVAAPRDLDPDLAECLEQQLYAAMTDPEFQAVAQAARRAFQPEAGEAAVRTMRAAAEGYDDLREVVEEGIRKVRS